MKWKYVCWAEQSKDGPVEQCIPVSEAIERQRLVAKAYNNVYPSDEAALDDFVTVYWAQLKE